MSKLVGLNELKNRIFKTHGDKIYLKNESCYRLLKTRYEFIDNRFGENVLFKALPENVFRGCGAPRYGIKMMLKAKGCLTKNDITKIAKRYNNRTDFCQNDHSAYYNAWRNGFLDEVCAHMAPVGHLYARQVYAIINSKTKTVYVGLSCDPNDRFKNHKKKGRLAVRKLIASGAKLKILSNLIEPHQAAIIEKQFVEGYRLRNFKVLNKIAAGGLGSDRRIWTEEKMWEAVLSVKTRTELRAKFPGARQAARKFPELRKIYETLPNNRCY